MLLHLYLEEKKKKKDSPDTQLFSHFLALLYYCTSEIKYHHSEALNAVMLLTASWVHLIEQSCISLTAPASSDHCARNEGQPDSPTTVPGCSLQ